MAIKEKNYSKGIIVKKHYLNGQLAVCVNNHNGEPIAELSINKNSVELASDEFILKDYSENSKIAQDLLDSKILISTDRFTLIGTHLCPVCRITV